MSCRRRHKTLQESHIPALFVAAGILLVAVTITAQPPVTTTIEEINSLLPDSVIDYVEVTGIFVPIDGVVELWSDRLEMQKNYRYNWIYHCVLIDGGAMPAIPEDFQGDSVRVTGHVAVTPFYYPYSGDPFIAEIAIDSFMSIAPAPSLPPSWIVEPRTGVGQPTECDTCRFALIVSGFNSPDYWNDVKQKYAYKKDSLNVCPENIIVLYKGGSRDAAEIPDGTMNGGSFTSGGAFDCNHTNLDSAFVYLKRKMKERDCSLTEFQFHSTGHGGGYHTSTRQGGPSEGYCGGRIDTSGDETRKISENDLKFCHVGEFDLDGDGTKDVRVSRLTVLNPPPSYVLRAEFDEDGDGTYEHRIGSVAGGTCIDKSVGGWDPPDINRSGSIDSVAFDDVLLLGDGEVFVDDELKAKLEELISSVGVTSFQGRAELAQCFSGSFVDDLADVTEEATSACKAGEVSISSGRGADDYNYYQKYFIDGLGDGLTWREAHDAAKDSLNGRHIREHPVYNGPFGTGLEDRSQVPSLLELVQNYPNPFNPVTTIRYNLPSDGAVRLEIFDALGRRVAVLVDAYQMAGEKSVRWRGNAEDGSKLASGVYFYRLTAGTQTLTRKMILLK